MLRSRGKYECVKVTIGFPNSSPSCADDDYCFFDEQESKTGRPVKRNLNAIKAKARSATDISIISVIAMRNGLSRKP